MEFPDLGQHCSHESCKQLDFLPFKCDSCSKVFCKDHIIYLNHNCASKKDFQVPMCPLCNQYVPHKRNELPDIVMSAHIDRDCQSDPAEERRRKIYKNRCNAKGCKQKELIPVICKKCNRNYCLKHRHETDHDCETLVKSLASGGSQANSVNTARLAFYERNKNLNKVQSANINDDDALKLAIEMSLKESQNKNNNKQLSEDEQLARALAESELEERRKRENNATATNSDKCTLN